MSLAPGVSAVAVLACSLGLAACGTSTPSSTASEARADTRTPLESASTDCDAGLIADAGQTLIIDTEGEEDLSGMSSDDLVCLLLALETPSSVIEHMGSTRALDGMQTNSWAQFHARWTYHPDDGMGLTITLAD